MSGRILILANHFVTLHLFRKELIQMLLNQGYSVTLSLPDAPENQYFTDLGCEIVISPIDRRGINPLEDLKLVLHYLHIIRSKRPDVILSYTIKPNIYGAIAANLLGKKQICNITGTGATFLRNNGVARIARLLYKISIRHSYRVFFQNSGDQAYFDQYHLVDQNDRLLPGSGVDLQAFPFQELPTSDQIGFLFAGRIMKLKGIDTYLEAAKNIHERFPQTRFVVAGFIEEPEYETRLARLAEEGVIEYVGFQREILPWIAKSHCVVLPSYGGEGIPNALLEAAATGRPCIASDIAGSRDVVEDGQTGYLFEPGQSTDLIAKMKHFVLLTPEQRQYMGTAGRQKVAKSFDRQIVIETYLQEIRQILNADRKIRG